MHTEHAQTAQQPTVSIIIPAHNAALTLERCVESVRAQTWPHLQILIVDDGSTDDTARIAQRLVAADERVALLSQPNAGVSSARNHGIREAQGTYLRFIDADDDISPTSTEQLLALADTTEADMTFGALEVRDAHGVHTLPEWNGEQGTVSAQLAGRYLTRTGPPSISGSVCKVLFRTAFIREHDLHFREDLAHAEDSVFLAMCLAADPSCARTSQVVYRYNRTGASATTRYAPRLAHDVEQSFDAFAALAQQYADVPIDDFITYSALQMIANWTRPDSPLSSKEAADLTRTTLRREPFASAIACCGSAGLARSRQLAAKLFQALPGPSVRLYRALVRIAGVS